MDLVTMPFWVVALAGVLAFTGCAGEPQGDLTATDGPAVGITAQVQESPGDSPRTEGRQMKVDINGCGFTATLADNSSAQAFEALLADGPRTFTLQDYAGMEKVGSLGTSLPTNDERIDTQPGDIILYQGSMLVIYYAPNSWSFTRLGRIDGVDADELIAAMGPGAVEVTLSLLD